MLKQRVVTALALLLVVLAALFLAPPVVWGVLTLGALVIAAHEWQRLLPGPVVTVGGGALEMAPAGAMPSGMRAAGAASSAAISSCPDEASRGRLLPGVVGVAGLLFLVWRLFTAPSQLVDPDVAPAPVSSLFHVPVVEVLLGLSVLTWVCVCVPSIVRARAVAARRWFAVFMLLALYVALYELRLASPVRLLGAMAIVWLADIGAYFFGRAFGRHKLAPRISPGKSWEGAFGGAFTAVAVAALVWFAWPSLPTLSNDIAGSMGLVPMLAWVVLIAALSVTGDLYESLLKREHGVKDSGTLFPGHGGLLDRIDAMVPTMPACVLLWLLAR